MCGPNTGNYSVSIIIVLPLTRSDQLLLIRRRVLYSRIKFLWSKGLKRFDTSIIGIAHIKQRKKKKKH